jgi:hypothetical protein
LNRQFRIPNVRKLVAAAIATNNTASESKIRLIKILLSLTFPNISTSLGRDAKIRVFGLKTNDILGYKVHTAIAGSQGGFLAIGSPKLKFKMMDTHAIATAAKLFIIISCVDAQPNLSLFV